MRILQGAIVSALSALRFLALAFCAALCGAAISGCSMSEEVKHIEQVRRSKLRRQAAQSTNLSGEQIFVRSCYPCHFTGRKPYGPPLDRLNEHFPDDAQLKTFIRQGKGLMPPQPKSALNDAELDNLVRYLRDMQIGVPAK